MRTIWWCPVKRLYGPTRCNPNVSTHRDEAIWGVTLEDLPADQLDMESIRERYRYLRGGKQVQA